MRQPPRWLALTAFGVSVVNLDRADSPWLAGMAILAMGLLARGILPPSAARPLTPPAVAESTPSPTSEETKK